MYKFAFGLSLLLNIVLFAVSPAVVEKFRGALNATPRRVQMRAPGGTTALQEVAADVPGTQGKDPMLADPKFLADKMRREGYPDHVIYQAVATAIKWRNRAERMKLTGSDNLQRWQGPVKLSAESATELKRLEAREDQELRRITDISVFLSQQAAANDLKKFGALSAEKVATIRNIEADYREIASKFPVKPGADSTGALERRLILKTEFETDIMKVLSKEEAIDYFRYNSEPAKLLQTQVGGLQMDEKTYVALADVSVATERVARTLIGDQQSLAKTTTGMYQEYRRILGDGDFATIIGQLDPLAGSLDGVYQSAELDPNTRANLFFSARDAAAYLKNGTLQMEPSSALDLYQKLTTSAGLTSAQIASFDRTRMGMLLQLASRGPRPH